MGTAVALLVFACAAQRAVSSGAWLCPHVDLRPPVPVPVLAGAVVPGSRSGAWPQCAPRETRALQPTGVKTRLVWKQGGHQLSCQARALYISYVQSSLRAPAGVFHHVVCPLRTQGQELHYTGFSTLFYYKDRLFQESATSTTQQVRALHPQHVPKFKNMLQRAWGFKATLQTLKLLLC